jgi:hypothetical protein
MPLTRKFKDTIRERAIQDTEYRESLLRESINNLLIGDMLTGKSILRNYINATIGFKELGKFMHSSPKSLMRMLSPQGNPTAANLFGMIQVLAEKEGVVFDVTMSPSMS